MSKEGPSVARWALSIAMDTVMRYNEAIAQYYKSVKERTGSGKQAHVSTTHKLVMMIYHMLSKREEWNYAENVLTENKLRNFRKLNFPDKQKKPMR